MRQECDRLRWLWLIYLIFFLMGPILYAPPRLVALSLLGVAVFLPIYFLAPRVPIGWKMLLPIGGMVALGLGFVRHNPGASVFFVYAAAECAGLGSRRRAFWALGGLMLLVLVVAFTWQENPFFGIPAVALVAVVGIATLQQREMRRAEQEIRRGHEEIERLARIAERERIARDLHDLLGHTLSLVVLKSELARKLAERDPARAMQEIGEVEAVARQALSEVRSAVTAYRVESLQGELIKARVALETAGVAMEIELEPVRLPPLHEGVLALATREAVTNVIRHAQASRCRVALRAESAGDSSAVQLVIEDDGRGAGEIEGSGLSGMRERVGGLGGELAKGSAGPPGASPGTRLAIWLPVPR